MGAQKCKKKKFLSKFFKPIFLSKYFLKIFFSKRHKQEYDDPETI